MLTGWPPPSRVPAPEIASIAGIEVDRLPWMMPTMCSLKCPQDQLAAELLKLERHLQSCSNLRAILCLLCLLALQTVPLADLMETIDMM